MTLNSKRLLCFVLSLALSAHSLAQGYEISRAPDGPFAFAISGVKVNEGSTLQRESILFNDPSCPVALTAHSTKVIYKGRGFRFTGNTKINANSPVVAIQVRSILYDVFGQHMKNLADSAPRDFRAGPARLSGEWRAYENDVTQLLTTVTYVARVRLADGTQWIYDIDNLQLALSTLNLEQKIGDDEESDD